jgi:hypothetical protein
MDRALERRKLLRGAGVAGASVMGVAMAPAAASAADEHHSGRHRLWGAWMIAHHDDPASGGATGAAVVAFAAGGVLTVEEMPDGTLGLGTWTCREHRVRARFFEAEPGDSSSPAVLVDVRVRGELHHDHLSGTYRGTVRTAADDKVVTTFTGTFTSERITV